MCSHYNSILFTICEISYEDLTMSTYAVTNGLAELAGAVHGERLDQHIPSHRCPRGVLPPIAGRRRRESRGLRKRRAGPEGLHGAEISPQQRRRLGRPRLPPMASLCDRSTPPSPCSNGAAYFSTRQGSASSMANVSCEKYGRSGSDREQQPLCLFDLCVVQRAG